MSAPDRIQTYKIPGLNGTRLPITSQAQSSEGGTRTHKIRFLRPARMPIPSLRQIGRLIKIRTLNLLVRSQMLFHLSYESKATGRGVSPFSPLTGLLPLVWMANQQMKRFGTFVIFLILAWLLLACGSAHHLRRAERLKKRMDEQIDKAIEKGAQVKRDTIFKEIQVFVPEVRTDTIFQDVQVGDTITITKEKLQIKYVRLPGDSVFIEGECESDTIFVRTEVAVNTKYEAKPFMKWWQFVGWVLLSLVAGFTLGRVSR